MKTLKEQLLSQEQRPKVIADCESLIDQEVASKKGISGLAIKTAYKMVRTLRPGMIRMSVEGLIDEFVVALEPTYAEFHKAQSTQGIQSYLTANRSAVAEALLGVTDDRARTTPNRTLKKAYEKLRPKGKEQVMLAVPGLGRVLEKNGI